jgi:hypothetical protein
MVYSKLNATSTDGVISVGNHTDAIYFLNTNYEDYVQVELNGGPHVVVLRKHSKDHEYSQFIGDYTSFRVLTAGAIVAVYAVG